MEQRWNARILLRVNAILRYDGLGYINGKTRDISFGGTFIESGVVETLALNSVLRVAFLVSNEHSSLTEYIRAMVVRSTGEGLGLMFTDFEPNTFSILDRLLTTSSERQGE